MISARITPNQREGTFDWEVADERPPRIKTSGTSVTLEDAIACVQSNLSLLVVDK